MSHIAEENVHRKYNHFSFDPREGITRAGLFVSALKNLDFDVSRKFIFPENISW